MCRGIRNLSLFWRKSQREPCHCTVHRLVARSLAVTAQEGSDALWGPSPFGPARPLDLPALLGAQRLAAHTSKSLNLCLSAVLSTSSVGRFGLTREAEAALLHVQFLRVHRWGVRRLPLPLSLPRSLHWAGSVLVLHVSADFAFILKLQVYYILA